eukprot:3732343-Pleurochrysis_carterae.AAC.1
MTISCRRRHRRWGRSVAEEELQVSECSQREVIVENERAWLGQIYVYDGGRDQRRRVRRSTGDVERSRLGLASAAGARRGWERRREGRSEVG